MSKMVEVVIDSVRVSLTNQQRIIILREVNHERYLPIWIGPYEAEAITISLQEIELARPQTHDLLRNLMKSLDARLLRVEVIDLQDDVYYGNLVLEANGNIINVDSRPSDALALAVRLHVPILVTGEILDIAGIVPEKDIQNDPEIRETSSATEDKTSEDRLSIFEDYLQNLDTEDTDKPEDDSEPDEEPPLL
ncbi:MAG: bifunctional nuclease family protein [Chloroflexi bacterium]|nr:bifunctional nuclease family protein [Chloroflexota bacterium]